MKQEIVNPLAVGTILRGAKQEYCIREALGQGSFGITYRATTLMQGALGAIEVDVAVKEFFMKSNNNRHGSEVTYSGSDDLFDNYKKMFAREAHNVSRLRHPHIVKILEYFAANNTYYYVMEYCRGGSLNDKIVSRGRLTEQEALGYFTQLSSAVSHMHAHKMLHLDIKPGNIVLRENGELVLIDFGLSKQYTADGIPETSTTIGYGTPGYAPIEQAKHRNDSKVFAATLDVYALGATLYKMLTGVTPPESPDVADVGLPVDMLRSCGVSVHLIHCLTKAMALRSQRYQSVAEFAQAVGFGGATRIDDSRQDDETHIEDVQEVIEAVEVEIGEQHNSAETRTSCMHNGHEYVDLGLPSGLKWATCNVGANAPEEYGNYYSWGETETKKEYTEENSITYIPNKTLAEKIKNLLGWDNNKIVLKNVEISGNSWFDAARRNWGGSWRMPTRAEWQELINNCTWTWTTQGGHKGYRVTGKNGNSIFLPPAGWYNGSSPYDQGDRGEYGFYWSSTPDEGDTEYANSFGFSSIRHLVGRDGRYNGHAVRPVCD